MIKCRACSSKIIPFFSLGQMPLANSFLQKKEIKLEKKYDLTVAFCPGCFLVQLTEIVPPEQLFSNYVYFSSTSKTILEHNKKTATYLTKKLKLNKNSLVLEIASNDGALLQYFKKSSRILGIDPAQNIARLANSRGIPTIAEFFNYSFAKQFVADTGYQADLVYGANVLAHVPSIVDFVKGVKTILKPHATAVFEFPYLRGLLENKFDIIYHEHVFYYGILALNNLFKKANLKIYDVEIIPMQGGSLRIFVSHPEVFQKTKNLINLINSEKQNRYDELVTYQKMNKRVEDLKKQLLILLSKIKKQGKIIAAYSAPAKGNILLNYFGIDKNYFKFIVDKAKEKQGLYTPGTNLLVYSLEKIDEEKPDYLLILCWNIYKEIIAMKELERFKKRGGKFIIPVPKLKII